MIGSRIFSRSSVHKPFKNQSGMILMSVLIFISLITSLLIFQLESCEMQAMMNANMRSNLINRNQ